MKKREKEWKTGEVVWETWKSINPHTHDQSFILRLFKECKSFLLFHLRCLLYSELPENSCPLFPAAALRVSGEGGQDYCQGHGYPTERSWQLRRDLQLHVSGWWEFPSPGAGVAGDALSACVWALDSFFQWYPSWYPLAIWRDLSILKPSLFFF